MSERGYSINTRTFLTPKLPWGIRIEMLTPRDDLLRQMRDIVMNEGVHTSDPEQWFSALVRRHLDGDAMIVAVRTGRILAGFLVLELAERCASYAWVVERFRGMGLGQRFYSCACTNLSVPKPEFIVHKALKDEFAPVLKNMVPETVFKDPFYVLNPHPAETQEAA